MVAYTHEDTQGLAQGRPPESYALHAPLLPSYELERVATTKTMLEGQSLRALARPEGTTAAERFCGQQPGSMVATILEAVESPPAPRSPPRHAVG
jgi:hypothetical protein